MSVRMGEEQPDQSQPSGLDVIEQAMERGSQTNFPQAVKHVEALVLPEENFGDAKRRVGQEFDVLYGAFDNTGFDAATAKPGDFFYTQEDDRDWAIPTVVSASGGNGDVPAGVYTLTEKGALLSKEADYYAWEVEKFGARVVVQSEVEVGRNVVLGEGVIVGAGAKVGENSTIHERSTVGRLTQIGSSVKIDETVDIGPEVTIGDYVSVGYDTEIGEASVVRNKAYIGTAVVLEETVRVGAGAKIESGAVIHRGAAVGRRSTVGIMADVAEQTSVFNKQNVPPHAQVVSSKAPIVNNHKKHVNWMKKLLGRSRVTTS